MGQETAQLANLQALWIQPPEKRETVSRLLVVGAIRNQLPKLDSFRSREVGHVISRDETASKSFGSHK
jgi:hypothetical protein